MSTEDDQKMPGKKTGEEEMPRQAALYPADLASTLRRLEPATASASVRASRTRGEPDEALEEIMQPPMRQQEETDRHVKTPDTGTTEKLRIVMGPSPTPRSHYPAVPLSTHFSDILDFFDTPVNEDTSEVSSFASTQDHPGAYYVTGTGRYGGIDDESTLTSWSRTNDSVAAPPVEPFPAVMAHPVRSMSSTPVAVPSRRWKRSILFGALLLAVIGLVVGLVLGLRGDARDEAFQPATMRPTFQLTAAPTATPIPANWTQVGQDLAGDASGGIAMSDGGDIVAIGGPLNDVNGINSGLVRVYRRNGMTWDQLGADINGEIETQFGSSVALSSNGTILVVGAFQSDSNGVSSTGQVRVHKLGVQEDWIQLGSVLNGEAAYDWFGFSVAVSSNGTILAVGATQEDTNVDRLGYVRVYRFLNEDWVQLGSTLYGEVVDDKFGASVALSSDGTILAVGATQFDTDGDPPGYVRAFRLVDEDWIQLGSQLVGDMDGDFFGRHVALSSNGTVLAVGATQWSPALALYPGYARVYRLFQENWIQVGFDLTGEAEGDFFGTLALSSDGTVLAVGADGNDENGADSGHVRIYQLLNSEFVQAGGAIAGKRIHDFFGGSVALSADGMTVAASAKPDGNTGYANIYQREE